LSPGDLAQVRAGVGGKGEVGVVLGPDKETIGWAVSLLRVMFHDGIRSCHPSNLISPKVGLGDEHESR
jgi:hypothetical protein